MALFFSPRKIFLTFLRFVCTIITKRFSSSILIRSNLRRMTPTFLAIGHYCYDVTPNGYVLGGSAAYSTITARNLGFKSCAITAVGNDFNRRNPLLNGVEVVYQESSDTTIFDNRYSEDGQRQQFVLALGGKTDAAAHLR